MDECNGVATITLILYILEVPGLILRNLYYKLYSLYKSKNKLLKGFNRQIGGLNNHDGFREI